MKGIEIAYEYYLQHGKPMLEEQFPDVIDRIAVGLAGEGSECLGFDDEISRDHDFEPGFCLWITQEDATQFGFKLERAYAKLPKEFAGLRRNVLSPVGGNRHGVITIEQFYSHFLGTPHAPDNVGTWLYTPSSALLAASNGKVFEDKLGVFSEIRTRIKEYPEDIRRKKLAAHLIFMAQSGQYNYQRCISRNELGAAQLAAFEFVKHTISVIYLLNNQYEPFYKWVYRGMKTLPILGSLSTTLQTLLELDNTPDHVTLKLNMIEEIAAQVSAELQRQSLSRGEHSELNAHAYAVQNSIRDHMLRNMHIMDGIPG